MAENNKNKNKVQIDPTYAHLQPQAVNVEQAVLGALMIDSDAFSVVSELLKPDTFYDPRHKRIYQAIQVMNMEERPVDIMGWVVAALTLLSAAAYVRGWLAFMQGGGGA